MRNVAVTWLGLVWGFGGGCGDEAARPGDSAQLADGGDIAQMDADSAEMDAESGVDTSAELDATGPDATDGEDVGDAVETPDASDAGDAAEVDATEVVQPVSGLNERASVTTCHAFARPEFVPGSDVAYEKAFPNMDFSGRAIGLVRTRLGPEGPMRWFVLDREGEIWTFIANTASKDGKAADGTTNVERAERYLELPETPYGTGGEGGLLGFAFDPDVALRADANYVYVHYTTWPNNNVWRFRVGRSGDPEAPWRIDEAKRIFVTESGGGNHWGGDLKFGPDGFLYLSLGDGGNGMTGSDAVLLTWLRGKILRIDPRSALADVPYRVPADNPFAEAGAPLCDNRADLRTNTMACPEIFARGFRNPWRMSFDRATGNLWVGDVGSGKEEVNLVVAGHDYGWTRCDGRNGAGCPPANADSELIAPIAQYRVYNSASIAGGVVYRGTALGPALQGAYLFTDVYNGELLVIDAPYANVAFAPTLRVSQVYEHPDEDDADDLPKFRKLAVERLSFPVSWAEDENGEPYVVTFGAGKGNGVYKLVRPGGAVVDTVPATLQATGCVGADDAKRPAAGMIPYTLNAPFWSDGATKERYIAIPDGTTIEVGPDGDWFLPVGAVVTKTFYLGGTPVETRLMVRHDDGGWAGYSYVWRQDGSDADQANRAGEQRQWGEQAWTYPSRSGCMSCHTAVAGYTLGLETRQLDRELTYPATGRTANQIDTLSHVGMFAAEVASNPATAFVSPFGDAPIEQRARTYLHTNCAQCHRGPMVPNLHFDTALGDTQLCFEKRLVPNAPEASTIVMRMRSDDPLFRMPRGSGLLIDEAGVGLIEAWIQGLTSCP